MAMTCGWRHVHGSKRSGPRGLRCARRCSISYCLPCRWSLAGTCCSLNDQLTEASQEALQEAGGQHTTNGAPGELSIALRSSHSRASGGPAKHILRHVKRGGLDIMLPSVAFGLHPGGAASHVCRGLAGPGNNIRSRRRKPGPAWWAAAAPAGAGAGGRCLHTSLAERSGHLPYHRRPRLACLAPSTARCTGAPLMPWDASIC